MVVVDVERVVIAPPYPPDQSRNPKLAVIVLGDVELCRRGTEIRFNL